MQEHVVSPLWGYGTYGYVKYLCMCVSSLKTNDIFEQIKCVLLNSKRSTM